MLRMIAYNMRLNMKQLIFWSSIVLGVVITCLMTLTDIRLGFKYQTENPVLYFIFVGITTQVSTSLLMLIHSFSTIQTYVKDYHSNHLLFLQHRLGNWRYFIQLYMSNCLTSFIVGVGMCVVFILLLALKFPLIPADPQPLIKTIAGGHWLLNNLPFWTYSYFTLIVGLNFAFYQLLATFFTLLFPHQTMCYLYSMLIWIMIDSLMIGERLPFYVMPRIVFGLDNTFHETSQQLGIALPMWYPFVYFFVILMIIVILSVQWMAFKRRWH
ncbi:hypothetical protein I4Q36_03905 [Tuanshanicoccus lijuaniae]|uniref:hypothetical protein n=2 Tax=Aerococcaceae bacterium zg-1292 TaxID=2774330 RepID=UPI001938348F|nr:hypothetical protein I4Q36_03905 [Aerococcaceae bacterium zg-1292]